MSVRNSTRFGGKMMSGAGCAATAARTGRGDAGYYRMERGWQDHELFEGERYCRRAAWEWLIAHAVWRRTTVTIRGTLIALERGQLCFSLRYLAEAWGWTISQVRGFLAALAKRNMIRTAYSIGAAAGRLIITVCNYDRFQGRREAAPNIISAPVSHKEETSEEGKNGREGPPTPPDAAPPLFAKLREDGAELAQPDFAPPPGAAPRPAANPRARGTNPRARGANPRGRLDPRQPEFLLTISGDPNASRARGARRSPHQTLFDAARKVGAARKRQMELSAKRDPGSGPSLGLAAAGA